MKLPEPPTEPTGAPADDLPATAPATAPGLEAPDEVYSHSRLSAFENCPQKFQYRYVWKLPAESESIEGFVGKRVHEVLERLHRTADRGRVPSLPKVLWRFGQLFEEAYDSTRVRIVREGTPLRFYRELGEHCIANYYHDRYPFDGDETLALEERVTLDLDGSGHYRLQGFVDRIARARDGAIEIQDYKTGARVPSQAQADQDRQLALYQMGFEAGALGTRHGEGSPVRLVWHYLRQGKTLISMRTPRQLAKLRDETRGLIDRIRAERVFAPKPSALCRWCEYREGCPANPDRKPDALPYARPAAAVARAPGRRPKTPPPADPGQLALRFSEAP